MVKEGVLDKPKVDAVFGVHIQAQTEVGNLSYRSGGEMASSDRFTIAVAVVWAGAIIGLGLIERFTTV